MVEVIVFAEGPTEEQFIKRVVAPALRPLQVYLKPQMLKTSQDARGGAINFDRLKFNARNTLRQQPAAVLTTLLDCMGWTLRFLGLKSQDKPDLPAGDAPQCSTAPGTGGLRGCRPERFYRTSSPMIRGLLFSDTVACRRRSRVGKRVGSNWLRCGRNFKRLSTSTTASKPSRQGGWNSCCNPDTRKPATALWPLSGSRWPPWSGSARTFAYGWRRCATWEGTTRETAI